jgi:hypothetical protein
MYGTHTADGLFDDLVGVRARSEWSDEHCLGARLEESVNAFSDPILITPGNNIIDELVGPFPMFRGRVACRHQHILIRRKPNIGYRAADLVIDFEGIGVG